ncbi:MAG: S-methyl-5'-thioadenosine phosphorylase, partial [Candidatus Aenigmatarchaeota archaeon]
MIKIGIIGGSGLEKQNILKDSKILNFNTKYGSPSSELITGKISNIEVVIILRHGKNHNIMPSNVPFLANIQALKDLGCTHIIATTACGSLRENYEPGDFVFIDQFIDRTTKRISTFYNENKVCHIPMAEPFCKNLRKIFYEEAKNLGFKCHEKGTVVTIEGPRFSSRAESNMFRQWGGDVINMTTVPEVVLAREAGLHYIAIGMVTDYDCWKSDEKHVDISMVLETFRKNAEKVQEL